MKHGKAILFLLALVCIVVGAARISTGKAAVAAAAAPAACSWKVVPTPKKGLTSDSLSDVKALSANNIWAVGWEGKGILTEQWNGSAWKVIPSPTPRNAILASLNAVATISAQDVWAVGGIVNNSDKFTTLTEHWNGTAWSIVPSPNPNPGTGDSSLDSVAAISSHDVWAVGQTTYNSTRVTHTLIEHWDGTAWSVVASPSPGTNDTLPSVAAISANDVWAVGFTSTLPTNTTALVEHWDGTAWTVASLPKLGLTHLFAVAAVSANDVWAVGSQGNGTLALHWNGTTWNSVNIPNPGGQKGTIYGALAVVSAHDIWAVGGYNFAKTFFHTISVQWNGTSWNQVASPNPQPNDGFGGVTVVPGTHQVWAVGATSSNQQNFHSFTATHC